MQQSGRSAARPGREVALFHEDRGEAAHGRIPSNASARDAAARDQYVCRKVHHSSMNVTRRRHPRPSWAAPGPERVALVGTRRHTHHATCLLTAKLWYFMGPSTMAE